MRVTVIYRVDPGALGPGSESIVEGFCRFAQKEFDDLFKDCIDWEIMPRFDKSEKEIQYKIRNRDLSVQQASLYLDALGKEQGSFESKLYKQLESSIAHYQHLRSRMAS